MNQNFSGLSSVKNDYMRNIPNLQSKFMSQKFITRMGATWGRRNAIA